MSEAARDILDQSVNELMLTVRAYNALTSEGTWSDGRWKSHFRDMTIRELIAKTSNELLREPNFGKVSLADVRQRLAEYGLYLRDEGPPSPPPEPQPTLWHRLQAIEAKLDAILARLP
jgi:DNA-directed RNA polymerase alpha subunit